MKSYWAQLKPRERLMLSVAGGVIGVLLLYLLLLEPFLLKAEEMEIKVASQQKDLHWLKQASVEVAQLQRLSAGNPAAGRQGQSLLTIVDQSAKQNQLGDSVKRVEPDGASRVRVWLEKAPFDEVSRWMAELETRYLLQVESAVIDKTEDSGRVNVRLVFLGSES